MIAIIPARGGSKGLPGKNIKMLCGRPLIAYTIEAAVRSRKTDRVIVTTDSEEIAYIARQYGAEIPFMRPVNLAEDGSSAVDVYLHAVEFLRNKDGICSDKFAVLLPTAPLRDEIDIDNAITLFLKRKPTTLISVVEADIPISWYYRMDRDGVIQNADFDGKDSMNNRQQNDKYYIPNGAIYILDYKLLKSQRTYYAKDTIGYVMPRAKSVDIDSVDDFKYAEYLIKENRGE